MKKSFYKLKVVKTRKNHECSVCLAHIPKGSRALVENGFNQREGYFTNYFHISIGEAYTCIDTYMDVQQPNDMTILEKIENPEFYGQLIWKTWREDALQAPPPI